MQTEKSILKKEEKLDAFLKFLVSYSCMKHVPKRKYLHCNGIMIYNLMMRCFFKIHTNGEDIKNAITKVDAFRPESVQLIATQTTCHCCVK